MRNSDRSGTMNDEMLKRLLDRVCKDDPTAWDEIIVHCYDDLRRYARRVRFKGKPGSTQQPTALVNELFLRIRRQRPVLAEGTEREFYRRMARCMHELARDAWKKKRAIKRGGGCIHDELSTNVSARRAEQLDQILTTDALDRLRDYSADFHEAFTLQFFLGLTVAEVAKKMNISESTAGYWTKRARTFLRDIAVPALPGRSQLA